MIQRSLYLLLAVVLALSLAAIAGCGGEEEEADTTEGEVTETTEGETTDTTEEGVSEGAADGRQVYLDTCAVCHSEDGTGGTGEDLTQLSLSEDEVAEQVRNGGGGMPPYGDQLSDEEIEAVSGYVVETFMQ
ncbi:MAG: hypothetical protein Kow00129_08740 [Thermoleophilia bacterium]